MLKNFEHTNHNSENATWDDLKNEPFVENVGQQIESLQNDLGEIFHNLSTDDAKKSEIYEPTIQTVAEIEHEAYIGKMYNNWVKSLADLALQPSFDYDVELDRVAAEIANSTDEISRIHAQLESDIRCELSRRQAEN